MWHIVLLVAVGGLASENLEIREEATAEATAAGEGGEGGGNREVGADGGLLETIPDVLHRLDLVVLQQTQCVSATEEAIPHLRSRLTTAQLLAWGDFKLLREWTTECLMETPGSRW